MISLALLFALVRYRRRFDVPGEPGAIRPLLAMATAFAAASAVALGVELHGGELPSRLSDVFTALGLLLGFGALFLWLRPLTHAVAQTVGERRVARALVEAYGHDLRQQGYKPKTEQEENQFFVRIRQKGYPTQQLTPSFASTGFYVLGASPVRRLGLDSGD